MLKKTITFEDYNGKSITEDFYFNLSKAEITEMELSEKGGLTEHLKKVIAEEDGKKLVELFKDLLIKSVGKRSTDGRRFIKNQEIVDDFIQTEAYSELFMELATNAEQAVKFVEGVLPSSMQTALATEAKTENVELPAVSDAAFASPEPVQEPSWITEGRAPNPEELKNATPEQLRLAYTRKVTVAQPTDPVA